MSTRPPASCLSAWQEQKHTNVINRGLMSTRVHQHVYQSKELVFVDASGVDPGFPLKRVLESIARTKNFGHAHIIAAIEKNCWRTV